MPLFGLLLMSGSPKSMPNDFMAARPLLALEVNDVKSVGLCSSLPPNVKGTGPGKP
jgi:hypothetical protein